MMSMTTSAAPAIQMPKENVYRALGIDPGAPPDVVKQMISKVSRLWSNRATNAPGLERRQEAERMMQLIDWAEANLLDPGRRAEYDRFLRSAPPPMPKATVSESDLTNEDLATKARQLLAQGQIEEARYVAQRATEKDQGNADAWAALGYAKSRLGKFDDAIYELRRAIELNPNEPAYCADLAFVYQELDQPQNALPLFQKAVQLDPNPGYRAGLGWLYVQNGMFREGLEALESAVREAPDDPYLQEHLARALVMAATQGWTAIGEGHPLLPAGIYPTDYQHISSAQAMIDRALSLKFDDQELRREMQAIRRDTDTYLKRRFTGNWFVAIVTAVIGIPLMFIPTLIAILYVVSAFTPVYKINRRLAMGKPYTGFTFLGPMFNDGNVGCVGLIVMYAIIIVLMPFVVIWNFIQNWGTK